MISEVTKSDKIIALSSSWKSISDKFTCSVLKEAVKRSTFTAKSSKKRPHYCLTIISL